MRSRTCSTRMSLEGFRLPSTVCRPRATNSASGARRCKSGCPPDATRRHEEHAPHPKVGRGTGAVHNWARARSRAAASRLAASAPRKSNACGRRSASRARSRYRRGVGRRWWRALTSDEGIPSPYPQVSLRGSASRRAVRCRSTMNRAQIRVRGTELRKNARAARSSQRNNATTSPRWVAKKRLRFVRRQGSRATQGMRCIYLKNIRYSWVLVGDAGLDDDRARDVACRRKFAETAQAHIRRRRRQLHTRYVGQTQRGCSSIAL
jgi:hypothetical protein